ncbi:MAG: AEC family transporter [Bacillota bacterium]|nr:AEC family transporter [Bacillota bacterium]
MDINVVITTMLKLFIILITGYALNKFGVFDAYVNKKISSLIVNLTSPLLVISSVSAVENQDKNLVLMMIGIGIVMYLGFIVIGKIVCRVLPFPKEDYPVYECMCVFANTGFMGYPVVQSVLDDQAVFYAAMIHMAFSFFVYTYGVICLNKNTGEEFSFDMKKLLTPGFILVFVALFIYLLEIQLPNVILSTVDSIGGLTSPLSMMMIGSSLAMYPLKESIQDWRSYLFALVRLLLIPTITFLVCKALNVDPYIASIVIITNGMPVGSMVLMLATQYDANQAIVTRNIIVSTVLSVVSIPLIVSLFIL